MNLKGCTDLDNTIRHIVQLILAWMWMLMRPSQLKGEGRLGAPKMSFGKDNPDLGPPFHTKSSKPSARKIEDDDGSQFSPSFEPLLVDSPYYVRERGRSFEVGSGDVGPVIPGLPGQENGGGGMIVGPDHPGFWRPDRQPIHPASPTSLPPYHLIGYVKA